MGFALLFDDARAALRHTSQSHIHLVESAPRQNQYRHHPIVYDFGSHKVGFPTVSPHSWLELHWAEILIPSLFGLVAIAFYCYIKFGLKQVGDGVRTNSGGGGNSSAGAAGAGGAAVAGGAPAPEGPSDSAAAAARVQAAEARLRSGSQDGAGGGGSAGGNGTSSAGGDTDSNNRESRTTTGSAPAAPPSASPPSGVPSMQGRGQRLGSA